MAPFNKIIYINLRESEDRNKFFRGQLKKSEINKSTGKPSVRRFDAFRPTKNDIDSNKYKFFTDRYSSKFLNEYGLYSDFSLSTLGCYLSHYYVYELIAELEDDYYIVFEDDVILDPEWFINLNKDFKFAPSDFDVIRQTWECPYNFYEKIDFNHYYSKFSSANDCSDFTGGLHFQIVKQRSARKIVNYLNEQYVFDIDAAMTTTKLNVYRKGFEGIHANFEIESDIKRPWDTVNL